MKTAYTLFLLFAFALTGYSQTHYLDDNVSGAEGPTSIEACEGISDPSADIQWNLFNNPTYPLADINVCDAWGVAKGTGASMAILDTGIKLAVNDLVVSGSYTTSTPPVAGPIYYGTTGKQWHGTEVAGIAAAKHNGIGIAGVAPQVELYNVANEMLTNFNDVEIADGIDWAAQTMQVDVINMSFAEVNNTPNANLVLALDNAINSGRGGLGTILVAAAGNDVATGVQFPANHPGVLAVGGSLYTGNPNTNFSHGTELDVVAPSTGVTTTDFYNANGGVANFGGTSAAAPHVAGVAALMVSANTYINGEGVRNVIRRTAQKAGNVTYNDFTRLDIGSWNEHMGYGVVDAKECVFTAEAFDTQDLDTHMRNSKDDYGFEPDTQSKIPSINLSNSPDIWATELGTGLYNEINPVYTGSGTTTIAVRVVNKSNTAIPINSLNVKLYWSKQANAYSWPFIWDGSTTQQNSSGNTVVTGGVVQTPNGIFNTGADIKPGEQYVYLFQWTVPNPDDYQGVYPKVSGKHGFSFVARIDSALDPMTSAESFNLWSNVKNNNNIAWKNVTVDVLAPIAPPSTSLAENKQFTLVPNPSNGVFAIASLLETTNDPIEFEVSDFYGNQIYKQMRYELGETLNLSAQLRDGLYFVKIKKPSGEFEIHKLIIGAK